MSFEIARVEKIYQLSNRATCAITLTLFYIEADIGKKIVLFSRERINLSSIWRLIVRSDIETSMHIPLCRDALLAAPFTNFSSDSLTRISRD